MTICSLVKLCLNNSSIEYLPAAFGRLCNLRVLELRENSIQVLPQSVSSLVQLERLDLGKNRLTEVPDVIGCLTNLHELCCDNNRISKISSRALSPLSRLIFLDLSCNHIVQLPSDPLPVSLGDLHLSSNRLRSLPESLCALENLTTLKVDNNALESLPAQLGHIVALAELNASKNRLDWLPPSIGLLRHLHTLQLDDNRLVDLPDELGNCSNLSLLSLANNRLNRLPEHFGSLRRLKVLVLSGNALRVLPYSFIGLHQLQALWLTEGQSKPVVQLHEDTDPTNGQRVLTCFLLPQRGATQSNGHSPCKDTSNQPTRSSRHHRQVHIQQRLAGVEEEEENVIGNDTATKSNGSSNYAESIDGDFRPRFEERSRRHRSHRRNPMVVTADDGLDDFTGYRSDVDGYRYHRRSNGGRSSASHYGSVGLCRPFEHGIYPGDQNQPQGRPPLPIGYYGAPLDFQFPPPSSHRNYYQSESMSIGARECMSDTESGARRRLFTGSNSHQRYQRKEHVQSQKSSTRPLSTAINSFEWPTNIRPSQPVHIDDPAACTGVPPTLADDHVDIGAMLSSISVTSASSATASLLMPTIRSVHKQETNNWQTSSTSQYRTASPPAVYAIAHNPSNSGLISATANQQTVQQQSVSQNRLGMIHKMAQQQNLPGFVGQSTPHCLGRIEPDSLISVGAGSTDSGFDPHGQSQHGSSAAGQLSGGTGNTQAMSMMSPDGVTGSGETRPPFADVMNRHQDSSPQKPMVGQIPKQFDDSDLVSVDAHSNTQQQQQYTIFSAVILKNPGLGFSIAGGRDSGCFMPFDDPNVSRFFHIILFLNFCFLFRVFMLQRFKLMAQQAQHCQSAINYWLWMVAHLKEFRIKML